MSKGKLIVIDGLDGTGKATQVELLRQFLINEKHLEEHKDFGVVDFPRYKHDSSLMVRKMLAGEFGDDPAMIDAYTASEFYSIDRSLSYRTEEWGKIYDNGGLIIADRYTFSNVIHQGSKIHSYNTRIYDSIQCPNDRIFESRMISFMKWLFETEYRRMQIPIPDLLIFLELTESANEKMLRGRAETAVSGDIHEKNKEYLNNCRKTVKEVKGLFDRVGASFRFKDEHGYLDSMTLTLYKFLTVSDELNPFDKETVHKMIVNVIDKSEILS